MIQVVFTIQTFYLNQSSLCLKTLVYFIEIEACL